MSAYHRVAGSEYWDSLALESADGQLWTGEVAGLIGTAMALMKGGGTPGPR